MTQTASSQLFTPRPPPTCTNRTMLVIKRSQASAATATAKAFGRLRHRPISVPVTIVAGRPAASSFSSMPTMNIFDRAGKKRQRARASLASNWPEYDYLRAEVAKRLVDRLEDIMREFPEALELGAYGPHVAKEICAVQGLSGKGGAGGIERLVRCGVTEQGLLLPSSSHSSSSPLKILPVLADEEHLPFSPQSFDLIISNLSLHWINDLPHAMRQACQALKPDGVLLASMLGGNTLKELRIALQLAEQEREGGISPHVSPAAHVADCGALLQAAGFALPTVDVDTLIVNFPDALVLMEHLQGMGESSAILTRRQHVSRETFLAAAAIYQELYGENDGSVPATFQVVYMIGWAPHESQPQPKKRGSGKVSLKMLQKGDISEGGNDGSGGCSRHK